MFDNETRKYIYNDDVFYGDWFIDEHGFLYMVPLKDEEIDGPDGEILDKLIKIVREYGIALDEEIEKLDLSPIPHALKRFSEDDGYYYA